MTDILLPAPATGPRAETVPGVVPPTVTAMPSHEMYRALAGQQLSVLDAGDREITRLWLETVGSPDDWHAERSFSLILSGPVAEALGAGVHHLRHGLIDLWVRLEQYAADLKHAHYEARIVVGAI